MIGINKYNLKLPLFLPHHLDLATLKKLILDLEPTNSHKYLKTNPIQSKIKLQCTVLSKSGKESKEKILKKMIKL